MTNKTCGEMLLVILITTIPLVYSSQTMKHQFNITDDDFSDLYKQAPDLVLKAHNTIRKKLNIPPLKLSAKLNKLSKEWAKNLARKRKFCHKPHNEYGENIYRENYQTGVHYPSQFVHEWNQEQKFFHRNMRFSELHRVSNFTQIIWKSTKYLGVAAATNDTYNEVYLVCMYDPPGNIVEDYQDNLDLDLLIPELEAGVAPPEKLDVSVRLRIDLCLMLVIIIPVWNILHC